MLDRNFAPVDAIKNSFETVKNNVGNALLAYLIMAVIGVVGSLCLLRRVLVAAPVSALFLVYTYRRLTGGQVAPFHPVAARTAVPDRAREVWAFSGAA